MSVAQKEIDSTFSEIQWYTKCLVFKKGKKKTKPKI